MNMKVRKSVIAFLMATTMVGSTAVPAMAGQITVKIQATGLQGESSENIDTILSDSLDIADTGSVTAMDVLKELAKCTVLFQVEFSVTFMSFVSV